MPRGFGGLVTRGGVLLLLLATPASESGLEAQDAPADTIPADTTAAPAPTDTVPADTTAAPAPDPADVPTPGDTVPLPTPGGPAGADTLPAPVAGDTTAAPEPPPLEHFPTLGHPVPTGWETGVWEWDREDLLGARAATLAELLEEIPGLIPLRGGDFGMPRAVSAFGSGGGGVRVFRDGVEHLPMEGSVPDLSRLGLGRVESVRVVRGAGGVEVHLHSLRADDPRPYSRIEAGTGDLDTNLLEGVFFHPRALGGNVAFALQRVDTRGPRGVEPGTADNVGLRYSYLQDETLGLVAQIIRSSTSRDTLFLPPEVQRTDWTLQGRWRPIEPLTGELFWSRSTMDADSVGGEERTFPFENLPRSQWGGRLGLDAGPVRARGGYRSYEGAGLPGDELSGELSATHDALGGAAASWSRRGWEDRSTATTVLRAWSRPFFGLSAFGSWSDFQGGVPGLPAVADPDADPPVAVADGAAGFFEGRAFRVGGRFRWRGVELSGARLDLERDSVHALGLPVDRSGPGGAAGSRTGWEAVFRLPVPLMDGLALEGSGQIWDQETGEWAYFPRRSWRGELSFHDVFFPTGNLEVWAEVGVESRDPMWVALRGADEAGAPPLSAVPSYQSWYSRLQIRVVTVRAFVRWENMTLRDGNQDFPGRVLPRTRAMYGIRWTLWD